MSAIDRIHAQVALSLTGVETQTVTADAGGDEVEAGILKGNRHQISVIGSLIVKFRLKGQAAANHSVTVVTDTIQTINLVNVDLIEFTSAANATANLVSYSER